MATYTTLQNGSKGDEVKKLQQSLIDAGYNVGSSGADGIYGNSTAAAVKAYQKANGLSVDGIAGNQTLGKLYGGSTATTTQPTPTYKYEEFKYDPYTKSDTVQQAEAAIQQQMAQKPGEFQYSWQTQLDDIYNKIMNREEFSYDLNGDALYQQYKDQYTAQGQMAMMDTMGQAQAMTGGYGNSYAQSVGQQAYQGYLQQLNDKVPELYQLALNQYNQEEQSLYNQAALLAQHKADEYGMHRDSVSDYYTELDYLTGRADTLAKNEYDAWVNDIGMKYNIHSDNQTAGYQEKQDANTLAMAMLSLGAMPDSALLATAGISSADANAIVQKVKEQTAASGSKGSNNGNNNNNDDDDKPKEDDTPKPKASDYADWESGDWGSYFSKIRQSEGEAAAEEELRYFTSNGLIPQKYVAAAATAARGGKLGH